ncbi:hypothetical protein BN1708_002229 [Verticillium longisporum]|uniref:Uncharacterized protein n=1 Tax=Verticillium longisporum TaxID=100787 RepID=A0A0G4KLF7_VERLO|nr:hypothetical protein BN1708_002229 [Verticillium longisporum]
MSLYMPDDDLNDYEFLKSLEAPPMVDPNAPLPSFFDAPANEEKQQQQQLSFAPPPPAKKLSREPKDRSRSSSPFRFSAFDAAATAAAAASAAVPAASAALAASEAEAESSTSAGHVYLKGIYDAMVKKVSDGADKYKENYKDLLESGDLWDRLTVQYMATFALFHSNNLPIRDAAALKSLPLVEHFWTLALQTLSQHSLKVWLPHVRLNSKICGVNVHWPINQQPDYKGLGIAALLLSEDVEERERGKVILTKDQIAGRAKMAETGYAGTSYAARRKPNGGLGKYYREADPSQGDPTTMLSNERHYQQRCQGARLGGFSRAGPQGEVTEPSSSWDNAAVDNSWAVSAEQDLTGEVAEPFPFFEHDDEEYWEDEAEEAPSKNDKKDEDKEDEGPPVWSLYPDEVYPRFDHQGAFPFGPEPAKVYVMVEDNKADEGLEHSVYPWFITITRDPGADWQPYCAQQDGPEKDPHTAGRLIEPKKGFADLYPKGFQMLVGNQDKDKKPLDTKECLPGASRAFYGWIPKRFMPKRATIGYWGFDGDCMDRQFRGLPATSSDDKRRKQPRKMASSAGTVFRSPEGNTMRLSVKLREEKEAEQHQARQTQHPSDPSDPLLPAPSQRAPRVEDEASLRALDTSFALLNDATLEDYLEQRGLAQDYAAVVDGLRQLRDRCRQDSTELQRTDPNPRPSPTLASAAMPHQRSGPQGTTNVAFRPAAAAAGKNLAEMEREDEEQKALFASQKARYHAGEEIKLSEACSEMLRYMKRNPPGPRP